MNPIPATPWHRASWDRLLNDRLPALLSSRLPGSACAIEPAGPDACTVTVTLGAAAAAFALPLPDADGAFHIAGRRHVVVPRADSDDLEQATVRCAGDLFHDDLADHIAEAEPGWDWDDASLRRWLNLDARFETFLRGTGQPIDDTNWLSAHTHLRRIMVPHRRRMFTPAHFGRVCPIETPEGENIGRVLTIARGAMIREGRLVIADNSAAAGLGLTASMVPFIESSDCCRVLMATNMMRQWIAPPDPEPALVQTGNEPDDPAFWCGRNLLTAYVDRGIDTFEDSIVISESCARRLSYPEPVECGDKLSNRSGNKGTIGRILRDDDMPHLPDGRAIDLVFSPLSVYSRLTYGQLREAVASWGADGGERPVIVPPFEGPRTADLRRRGAAAGLDADGMTPLLDCKGGSPLPRPATVGHVYWGRLIHRARPKVFAAARPSERCQKIGEPEAHALRLAGAREIVRELFHTLACAGTGADTVADRLAAGPVAPADGPAPGFAALQRRLDAAGIRAEDGPDGVRYAIAPPSGETLALAEPVPHPWRPEATVSEVGIVAGSPDLAGLQRANERLAGLAAGPSPGTLVEQARAELARRLTRYLDGLVGTTNLRFRSRVLFTGRAVIAPAAGLLHDQVGLPEEMAWTLFAPMLTRLLGDPAAVRDRTPAAAKALDALMARSWVLVHRMPTMGPASFLAFHPVRMAGAVIRLHPMANVPLNADYDGDQVAVFLPITDQAQREAGETLTVAAQIRRDRRADRCPRPLYDAMFGPVARQIQPKQGARFGLAWLAFTPEGHAEVERIAGVPVPLEGGVLTAGSLQAAAETLIGSVGVDGMLDAMGRLWGRGFEESARSGASLSAFPSLPIEPPAAPSDDDIDAWAACFEEYLARVVAWLNDPASGADPARITIRSGARGVPRHWLVAAGLKGVATGCDGEMVPVKHGQAEGLSAAEYTACCVGMREGLARAVASAFDSMHELREAGLAPAYGVLARARRARRPGVVFARAAAAGEIDPLTDEVSRLFVGRV